MKGISMIGRDGMRDKIKRGMEKKGEEEQRGEGKGRGEGKETRDKEIRRKERFT